MLKLLSFAVILLSPALVSAQGASVLDVFTSPDGSFQFSYPETYQLLSGERILTATQGRHLGFPVCDFSKSLVCVIYPIEKVESNGFEAAGFSVDAVPVLRGEPECLEYVDRGAATNLEHSQPSSFNIRGRIFHHLSAERRMGEHAQSLDLYRAYEKDRCYELRVAISLTNDSNGQSHSSSKSNEFAETEKVRASLKLVLSTFVLK